MVNKGIYVQFESNKELDTWVGKIVNEKIKQILDKIEIEKPILKEKIFSLKINDLLASKGIDSVYDTVDKAVDITFDEILRFLSVGSLDQHTKKKEHGVKDGE